MFIISNDMQYRTVCVPADTDARWYFVDCFDNLSDAQRSADGWNRTDSGNRYHVTLIGDADSLRAGLSDIPPASV